MTLDEIREEHTKDEFVTRDIRATLATMVDDAYVMPWMLPGVAPTYKKVQVNCRRTRAEPIEDGQRLLVKLSRRQSSTILKHESRELVT